MSLAGSRLLAFEAAVISNRYQDAEAWFSELLEEFANKQDMFTATGVSKAQKQQDIQKLSDHIVTWLSDTNYTPSPEFYKKLCMSKSYLMYLFTVSRYGSTDVIIEKRGLLNKKNYSPDELKYLLLLVTPNSAIKVPWAGLFGYIPNEAITAFVGMLGSLRLKLTKRNEHQIQDLIDAAKVAPVPNVDQIEALSPLLNVYFMCSNLSHPDKYEIKKWVAKVLENFSTQYLATHFDSWQPQPQNRQRKKVLVVNEHYHSQHAMYRCWHHMISNLNGPFELHGLGPTTAVDELGQQDFETFLPLSNELDLRAALERVIELQPDIIVYPSLGMSMFAPLMGALRLAPIQVVCGGHPSSSYLQNMDYFCIPDTEYVDILSKDIFSEKIVSTKRVSSAFLLDFEKKAIVKSSDEIHVAVNGLMQKVSMQTVDVCKQIEQKSEQKVVFHFYLADKNEGVYKLATEALLHEQLNNFEVHTQVDYQTYMDSLSSCHFAIPTVPFGGSNSNLDLMRLGIPKLFILDGSDLSGVTDHYHWQEFGNLFGFCDSAEQLIVRAAELCNDPQALLRHQQQISELNITQRNTPNDQRFVEVLNKILLQHQSVQESHLSEKLVSFDDFATISPYWFDCIGQITNLATPSFNLTNDSWSQLIQKVVQRVTASDLDNAIVLLKQAIDQQPTREVYLAEYLAGLVSYLRQDADSATNYFNGILELDSTQIMARYYLALCKLKKGQYEPAYQLLESCLGPTTYSPVLGALAVMAGVRRDHQNALKFATLAQNNNIEVGNGLVGLTKFQAEYFANQEQSSANLTLAKSYFSKISIEESRSLLSQLPESQTIRKERVDSQALTIFLSSDSRYFNDYVLPQVQSIINASTKFINFHIHIMNPVEGDVERISRLAAHHGVGLTVSIEQAPEGANGLYYSSARFCRLFEYLDEFEGGVLSLDADMLFRDCPYLAVADKQVRILHCNNEPIWQEVSAATLYLKAGDVSRLFMANVSSSIIRHLTSQTHPGRWFLDQLALFNAWYHFDDTQSIDKFEPSTKYCDLTHSDDSLIWAVGNDKERQFKYNTEVYKLKAQIKDIEQESFNQVSFGKYGKIITNKHDQYVGNSIHKKGVWCEHEVELISKLVKAGDTVIDAGANYGALTLPLSKLVGNAGSVLAFEPQRLVFQALCGTLALNNLTNVITYRAGLGSESGHMNVPSLNFQSENNFGGVSLNDSDSAGVGEPVDIMTIDSLNLQRLDLIKADVEGMELFVLKGGSKTISLFKPVLYLENHIEGEHSAELIKYCQDLGYQLYWHGPSSDRMMLGIHSLSDIPSISGLEPV